jgi:hypothetical protein
VQPPWVSGRNLVVVCCEGVELGFREEPILQEGFGIVWMWGPAGEWVYRCESEPHMFYFVLESGVKA